MTQFDISEVTYFVGLLRYECISQEACEMDHLLNTKQLADYLGVAESTILQYRVDGNGPVYIKLGHLVRYRVSDVDEWLKKKIEQANI